MSIPKPRVNTQRKRKAGHRRWAAKNGLVPGSHFGDTMSPATRSQVMSRIRGKDTLPELAIAKGLLQHRLRLERHARDLPGRPDFICRQARVAIFVDGSFWHGWRFPLWRHKLSPSWQAKIEATRTRDRRNFARLRRAEWLVVRIWEHQIERSAEACVLRIVDAIARRRR